MYLEIDPSDSLAAIKRLYNDDGPIDPELEALANSVHAQIFKRS